MLTQVEKLPLTKSNGSGRGPISPLQETMDSRPVSLWERLFKWENLTVAGREVKGLVVTPTMGLTIVLALGTVIGGMYYRTSDAMQAHSQEMREIRDMTIEMKARLDERTNAQKEAESTRKREQTDNEETAKVWRETMGNRMSDLEKKVGR